MTLRSLQTGISNVSAANLAGPSCLAREWAMARRFYDAQRAAVTPLRRIAEQAEMPFMAREMTAPKLLRDVQRAEAMTSARLLRDARSTNAMSVANVAAQAGMSALDREVTATKLLREAQHGKAMISAKLFRDARSTNAMSVANVAAQAGMSALDREVAATKPLRDAQHAEAMISAKLFRDARSTNAMTVAMSAVSREVTTAILLRDALNTNALSFAAVAERAGRSAVGREVTTATLLRDGLNANAVSFAGVAERVGISAMSRDVTTATLLRDALSTNAVSLAVAERSRMSSLESVRTRAERLYGVLSGWNIRVAESPRLDRGRAMRTAVSAPEAIQGRDEASIATRVRADLVNSDSRAPACEKPAHRQSAAEVFTKVFRIVEDNGGRVVRTNGIIHFDFPDLGTSEPLLVSFDGGTPKPLDDCLADLLAELFMEREAALVLLQRAQYPVARVPWVTMSVVFWSLVVAEARKGACRGDGVLRLVQEAAEWYPGNERLQVLRSLLDPDA